MTFEEGIDRLADIVVAELRAAGDVDKGQFLAAKFKSIDAALERRGWTSNQRRQAFLNLGQVMGARLGAAPANDRDPMERLADEFAAIALARPWSERRDILNDAFTKVRTEIDRRSDVPKAARDRIFGKFAFALAAHVVEPAGRA